MDLSRKNVVSNQHNLFLWQSCKLMDNREPIDVIYINITIFSNILYGNLINTVWKSGLDYFPLTGEILVEKVPIEKFSVVLCQIDREFWTAEKNLFLVNIFIDDWLISDIECEGDGKQKTKFADYKDEKCCKHFQFTCVSRIIFNNRKNYSKSEANIYKDRGQHCTWDKEIQCASFSYEFRNISPNLVV